MRLLMIGCGAMGQAMLLRWLDAPWLQHSTIVKPSPLPDPIASHDRIQYTAHADTCSLDHYDVILWAVKPQKMHDALRALIHRPSLHTPLHVTIAAALSLAWYEDILGTDARIIRAMPNTPVSVGLGVTGLVANTQVTSSDCLLAEQMMQSLGTYYWIHNESEMDLFTAVAGCGPAYVFGWMQAWCEAATAHGMPYDDARTIIAQTIRGSVALSEYCAGGTLNTLVANVTSKGGMTEAALQQLDKNHQWREGFTAALDAALKRAKALTEPDN